MGRQRKSSIARLIVATIVAMLPLLGELSLTAHHALHRHVVCASHGELLEVGDSSNAHSLQGARASGVTTHDHASHRVAMYSDTSDATDIAKHEHCGLAAFTRQQFLTFVGERLDAGAVLEAIGAVVPRDAGAHTSVPTVLLAPKHSPPV